VGQAILGNGVPERLRNVILPDEIVESLRTVFSSKNLITHGLNLNGKVDGW
jgi:hypothetical protein